MQAEQEPTVVGTSAETPKTAPRSRRDTSGANETPSSSPLFRMIYTLIMLLEAKDPFFEDHSSKVAQMSAEIGRHLDMKEDDLLELQLGGLLHDIGNLGIRDELLQRRARLKEDEKTMVAQHTDLGVILMQELFEGSGVLDIIKYHHERWDGSGRYGLAGENIPLGARIVSVADSFDAMSSDRPYRLAMTPEQYMFEFRRSAGQQYDPAVVKALLDLLTGKTGKAKVPTTCETLPVDRSVAASA